jgi:hypothetical protein
VRYYCLIPPLLSGVTDLYRFDSTKNGEAKQLTGEDRLSYWNNERLKTT